MQQEQGHPAVIIYWLATGPSWIAKADDVLGPAAVYWGLPAVGAGLTTWFGFLTIMVRFLPNRLGPGFFRAINTITGMLLLGFGAFCLLTVLFHRR